MARRYLLYWSKSIQKTLHCQKTHRLKGYFQLKLFITFVFIGWKINILKYLHFSRSSEVVYNVYPYWLRTMHIEISRNICLLYVAMVTRDSENIFVSDILIYVVISLLYWDSVAYYSRSRIVKFYKTHLKSDLTWQVCLDRGFVRVHGKNELFVFLIREIFSCSWRKLNKFYLSIDIFSCSWRKLNSFYLYNSEFC